MNGFLKSSARVAAMTACGFIVSAGYIVAQDDQPAAPVVRQAPGGRPQGLSQGERREQMLERMTRRLNLSPDQVTQIRAIDADTVSQMQALRNDPSKGPDKRAKMMAIRQDSQTKIHGLLTEQQRSKYDEMLGQMEARAAQRRGGQGGSTPSAPQQ